MTRKFGSRSLEECGHSQPIDTCTECLLRALWNKETRSEALELEIESWRTHSFNLSVQAKEENQKREDLCQACVQIILYRNDLDREQMAEMVRFIGR